MNDADSRIGTRHGVGDFTRPVGRMVVDDDHLELDVHLSQQRLQSTAEVLLFIAGRDDHRDPGSPARSRDKGRRSPERPAQRLHELEGNHDGDHARGEAEDQSWIGQWRPPCSISNAARFRRFGLCAATIILEASPTTLMH